MFFPSLHGLSEEATNGVHVHLSWDQIGCMKARNQRGTLGWAKSFLRGAQIFKLCSVILNFAQHILPGGRNPPVPPSYGPGCMYVF